MSDTSQGPGWWQASDDKWYPPEQAPQAPPVPPATPPGVGYSAPTGQPPGYGPPPGSAPAYGAPSGGYAAAGGSSLGYGDPGGGGPGQLVEWPQRVLAYLIDSAFIFVGYIALVILTVVFGAIADVLGLLVLVVGYIALVGAAFYFAYLTGVTGQSPGKRIIGIKVIGEQTGQPIGGGPGVIRQLAHFLDGICLIGYLFPLWDPKKQTFADKIMKTVVVAGPKSSFGPEIFKA